MDNWEDFSLYILITAGVSNMVLSTCPMTRNLTCRLTETNLTWESKYLSAEYMMRYGEITVSRTSTTFLHRSHGMRRKRTRRRLIGMRATSGGGTFTTEELQRRNPTESTTDSSLLGVQDRSIGHATFAERSASGSVGNKLRCLERLGFCCSSSVRDQACLFRSAYELCVRFHVCSTSP